MIHAKSLMLFCIILSVMTFGTVIAEDALYIDATGNVGIGTSSPSANLDVVGAEALLQVRATGTAKPRGTLILGNNGKNRFFIKNSTHVWSFDNDRNYFNISKLGSGVNEFRVQQNGNGWFRGDVYAKGVKLTSSRKAKTDFAPVEPESVLEKLAMLEVSHWRFKGDEEGKKYIGPMAEDFAAVFGVGDGNHIDVTDANGVAYAAIQGLNAKLEQKEQRIAVLEAQNARLEERLRVLEQAVLLSANTKIE